jgi:hypothetical protein
LFFGWVVEVGWVGNKSAWIFRQEIFESARKYKKMGVHGK